MIQSDFTYLCRSEKYWRMCILLRIHRNIYVYIIYNALKPTDIYPEIHLPFILVILTFQHFCYWQCVDCAGDLRMRNQFTSKPTRFIHLLSCILIITIRTEQEYHREFRKPNKNTIKPASALIDTDKSAKCCGYVTLYECNCLVKLNVI